MEYYKGKHSGAQIDEAVEMVLSGDIITDNMSHNVGKDINIPVSGNGVYEAIEEAKTELNTQIGDKVDKVDGKGLSTNDYDDEAKAEVAKVEGKQDKLVVSTLGNGNIKVEGIGEFMAATPSGSPQHDLYISLGALYNDSDTPITRTTKWGETVEHLPHHWYLGGLGDMTNEDMAIAYNETSQTPSENALNIISYSESLLRKHARTTFATIFSKQKMPTFVWDAQIETIDLVVGNASLDMALVTACNKLRAIAGAINVSTTISNWSLPKLEYVQFKGLNTSRSIEGLPKINKPSLLYLIQNATPTQAIILTVSSSTFEWASVDADVIAALEAQPNLTLTAA